MDIDFNNPPCPYGHPLQMIDRVTALDSSARTLVASKAVSRNEPLIQGHFPGLPILPGILQLETLVQASSILLNAIQSNTPAIRHVVSESRVKHIRPVFPGDLMTVETRLISEGDSTYTFRGRILVGGEEAAKGQVVLESLENRRRRLVGAEA